jgi:hypothetical protein
MRSRLVAVGLALCSCACANSTPEGGERATADAGAPAAAARHDHTSVCAGVASKTIDGQPRRVRLEVSPCRVGRGETARMVLVNTGTTTLGYGPSFTLERRIASKWRRINRRQGFPLPLLYLEPGRRSEPEPIAVYLSRPDPIELAPGLYRVTKGVDLKPGRPRPPTMAVGVRFRVVE